MGKMLYLECSSGISGDMAVAALIDAGASEDAVRTALASLPVEGFEVRIGRVVKSGLDVCDFDVILDAGHENHDHDMAYLHGHDHGLAAGGGYGCEQAHGHAHVGGHAHADECGYGHGHAQEHERAHAHEDGHAEERVRADGREHEHEQADERADERAEGRIGRHPQGRAPIHPQGHSREGANAHAHEHAHAHRDMAEITAILDAADLTDGARSLARRIFEVIAQAEAEAHGVPIDQVHFHEVGAVDSIADIVAAAVALDDLSGQGISDVVVTELCEGRGTVRCQHGLIPVPAPAVVNIARGARLSLRLVDVDGELITPTGAAIAAAARTRFALPERFTIDRVGMGAGKRAYETPGILRALIIEGE